MRNFKFIFLAHAVVFIAACYMKLKPNFYPAVTITNNVKTTSERIVFFLCSGLSAEDLYHFSNNVTPAPFLRSIIENYGAWGISYARVPTEARSGVLALMTGHYEDPSSVFQVWKESPVLLDSVFNQTDATFMWGSQEILQLFHKDSKPGNIFSYSYPSEMLDYSGKYGSAIALDNWVLENFINFNEQLLSNKTLKTLVHGKKVVFFFQLLGIKLTGYVNKPSSVDYHVTLSNADRVVKALVKEIDSFFDDKKTTYLFTSDHGMTDWGSHGAGTKIETNTPIVAWGAGIKVPFKSSAKQNVSCTNSRPNDVVRKTPGHWKLSHLLRNDMNQADVAVLMSIILGIAIPVNSVGVLPFRILDFPLEQIAEAYFLNAKQLMMQSYAMEKEIKSTFSVLPLSCKDNTCYDTLNNLAGSIEHKILSNNHTEAMEDTDQLIALILSGMDHFDLIYRSLLTGPLLQGFGSLILIIIGQIMNDWHPKQLRKYGVDKYALDSFYTLQTLTTSTSLIALLLLFFGFGLLSGEYALYFIGSLCFTLWSSVGNRWIFSILKLLFKKEIFGTAILSAAGVILLICSFFHKWILYLGMTVFSMFPFYSETIRAKISCLTKVSWVVSCVVLSVFPIFRIIDNKENIRFKIWVGVCMFVMYSILLLRRPYKQTFLGLKSVVAIMLQLYLTPFILFNMINISGKYSRGEGLPLTNQLLSFMYLGIMLTTMTVRLRTESAKIINIGYSGGMCFLMFSISYEALFPFVLSFNVAIWMYFELILEPEVDYPTTTYHGRIYVKKYLSAADLRKCFIFLFYVMISFFGIGNSASFNSFNNDWTRHFVGSFSPISIIALIILRTVLPLFLVTCSFRYFIRLSKNDSKVVYLVALIFLDMMAAFFFFRIQTVQSWLDIGTYLACFVIIEGIILFISLLYILADFVYPFSDMYNYY